MGFLSGLGDLVKQFSGGSAAGAPTAEQFSQLAGAVPQSSVASGLAEVFRSGETAPFAQLASQLFSHSNGTQQASVLNSLVAAVGPEVLSKVTGSSSSPLASLLAGNQAPITPDQAATIKPEDIQTLAEHAEKADPSIIDKLSELYAAHPQLIQGLGAAAVAVAAKHIMSKHEG
jgi:hypothetical protein